MKNILFVSIAFPPKNDPECIQTARYLKYLKKADEWNISVVTSAPPTLFMPVDESLKKYDTGYQQKIEIPLFESKLLNFLLRKLNIHKFTFPDSKTSFHWQWKKVVRHLEQKPEVIYSRSNPMSSAFMALKLKEHFNIPWIMHLSDPWTYSPLENIPASELNQARAIEEQLISTADKITFTTKETMNLYASKYEKYSSRFSVLPNVYDPEDVLHVAVPKNEKLRVVYTGGLAGTRNVFFLDKVLKVMETINPDVKNEIEFLFAGDMDRANRVFFENAHSCIVHKGLLKYSDVKLLSQTAHLLMVVDSATTSSNAIFFPSKLLDYFIVRRKIWAITPAGSVTREVLSNSNHVAHTHQQIDSMAEFLLTSIQQLKENKLDEFQSTTIPSAYSAETNAIALSTLLKSQVSQPLA